MPLHQSIQIIPLISSPIGISFFAFFFLALAISPPATVVIPNRNDHKWLGFWRRRVICCAEHETNFRCVHKRNTGADPRSSSTNRFNQICLFKIYAKLDVILVIYAIRIHIVIGLFLVLFLYYKVFVATTTTNKKRVFAFE